MSLRSLKQVALYLSHNNVDNCRIRDIVEMTDKLSVLLNYTSMIIQTFTACCATKPLIAATNIWSTTVSMDARIITNC